MIYTKENTFCLKKQNRTLNQNKKTKNYITLKDFCLAKKRRLLEIIKKKFPLDWIMIKFKTIP